MEEPILLFCRVAWMEEYNGPGLMNGGGKIVQEFKTGAEMYNFKPWKEVYYGYTSGSMGKIKVERLGAEEGSKHVKGITVVWFAKEPKGSGQKVVGWYHNATVYHELHERPFPSEDTSWGRNPYNVEAQAHNAILIPESDRKMEIPCGKGAAGQANVAYFDDPSNKEHALFRKKIIEYINRYEKQKGPRTDMP